MINYEITELDLSCQNLKEIPRSILDYPKLKNLRLWENEITFIPDFLSELKNLESIDLSENKLTQIPVFFEEYKYLKFLNLDDNNISKLELDFNKMKSLFYLSINNNKDFSFIDKSFFENNKRRYFQYEYTALEKCLNPIELIHKSQIMEPSENYELENLIKITKRLNNGIIPSRYFDDLKSIFCEFMLCGYEPSPAESFLCAKILHYDMKDYKDAKMYYHYVIDYAYDDIDLIEKSKKALIELEKIV